MVWVYFDISLLWRLRDMGVDNRVSCDTVNVHKKFFSSGNIHLPQSWRFERCLHVRWWVCILQFQVGIPLLRGKGNDRTRRDSEEPGGLSPVQIYNTS